MAHSRRTGFDGQNPDVTSADALVLTHLFQRLHERGRYEGSGMGLAIAKKIAERHQGEIWLNPEPSFGSEFCLSLPEQNAFQQEVDPSEETRIRDGQAPQ